ncbi:MAG TPA: aminotransferase class I/II-fold pyridoxal phosphate-dependent enzyme [Solirubrobacteraceae bacterium]|jgi:DNA-binding transcriptional MocR family regulator|nr:aminotransferase class I/II-fold pyridoxal phosphate-dependent enzyme [Solirubrobacteraceae bacterium]
MTDLKQYRIKGGSAAELVRSVEAAVSEGALAPGEPLPSVRRLAADVGLSPVTVTAALAELRRRGVIVSEPRRGSRVGERPPIGASRAPLPVPPGACDLSQGNPDPGLLPDLKRALAGTNLPLRLYGEQATLPELAALASERLAADGILCESPCVLSGALDAIERVVDVHLRPGDRVAVENPGYAALFDLLRARGLSLEPVAVDERGMRPKELQAALRRGASAAIVTPRGQNPTGAAFDSQRAEQLRDVLAREPQVLAIEDDHLAEAAGCPLQSIVGGRERWAAARSVAKTLGPDLRVAVLAGDEQTLARVQGRQQCGPGWVSHILQRLVLGLWQDPHVQELTERAGETYAARREHLLRALRGHGIEALGASGLNVWVPVEDETGVVGALSGRGWVVAPGAPYRLAASAPAIRITIATLAPRESELLAADIAEVCAPARAARAG